MNPVDLGHQPVLTGPQPFEFLLQGALVAFGLPKQVAGGLQAAFLVAQAEAHDRQDGGLLFQNAVAARELVQIGLELVRLRLQYLDGILRGAGLFRFASGRIFQFGVAPSQRFQLLLGAAMR